MEVMTSGLTYMVSKIRGNMDLIDVDKSLVMSGDVDGFAKAIACMTPIKIIEIGQHNMNKVWKFDVINVIDKMRDIYKRVVN